MNDRYSEVSQQGWLSRLGESIKGVLAGLVLALVAFPLLWWNEGRAVQTAKSLAEGAGAVVDAPNDKVDATLDGKLVHVSGEMTSAGPATDMQLGVSAKGLRLTRSVEMFQWREHVKEKTEKKLGGGTETVKTYEYDTGWSGSVVNSSSFKVKEGHANPGSMPYEDASFLAPGIALGPYQVPERVVGKLSGTQKHPVADVPPGLQGRAVLANGGLFLGKDQARPQVGDVRITYDVLPAGPVSIVSRQSGRTFEPYQAKAGDSIELVRSGTVPASAMFQAAQDANSTLTWILRVLGYFLMALGFYLVLRPLAVVGDVVPFVGSALAFGAGLVAALVSAALSSITIAIAWIFYRPLIGILMLVVGVAAFMGIAGMSHRRKTMAQLKGSTG